MADLLLPLNGGSAQPPQRRCSKCKAFKDRDEFFDRGDRPHLKRSECKSCSVVALHRYRLEHGQPYDPQQAKVWRRNGYEARRVTLRGWITANMRCRRHQCRKKGITFTITPDDVMALYESQNHRCSLTGRELLWGLGTNRSPDTLSVDRIDAAGPYVLENIRLVTNWANIARQRFTDAEFVDRCRAVLATREDPS